jgi:hypothetical protein
MHAGRRNAEVVRAYATHPAILRIMGKVAGSAEKLEYYDMHAGLLPINYDEATQIAAAGYAETQAATDPLHVRNGVGVQFRLDKPDVPH